MKKSGHGIAFLLFIFTQWSFGQQTQPPVVALISDTQAPMRIEKLFLKSDHNETATAKLFEYLIQGKPTSLFILGDVTSWSAKEKKWRTMDRYLQSASASGISTHALLGNHDVMGSVRKGESNFKKRFPDAVFTGYFLVVDSMAFVMLNSNFNRMKSSDMEFQQKWYEKTLGSLDIDPSVKLIIVLCHHAPYSNSKIVGSSKPVQEHFVPLFLNTSKCKLFITGHSHAFEHFVVSGKDFLVIGGGGGLHQPLSHERPDIQSDYKPLFHFLTLTRTHKHVIVDSYSLSEGFSSINKKNILD